RTTDGARTRTIRHLLLAVPRANGARRRDDRSPRIPAAADVPSGSPSRRARRALLRRHHERVRRDARLRGTDQSRGSLGDRRVPARAAAQRTRHGRRRSGRSPRLARSAAGTDGEAVALAMRLTDTADVLIPELRWWQQRLLTLGAIGLAIAVAGA